MASVFEIAEKLNNGEQVLMPSKSVPILTEQLTTHSVKLRGDAVNIRPAAMKGYSEIQLNIFMDGDK